MLLLAGLPGLSRAGTTADSCGLSGPVSCYALFELKGRSLGELTGLKEAGFRDAMILGNKEAFEAVRAYLPVRHGSSCGSAREYGVPGGPVICTYTSGENLGPFLPPRWPMTQHGVDGVPQKQTAVLVGERHGASGGAVHVGFRLLDEGAV